MQELDDDDDDGSFIVARLLFGTVPSSMSSSSLESVLCTSSELVVLTLFRKSQIVKPKRYEKALQSCSSFTYPFGDDYGCSDCCYDDRYIGLPFPPIGRDCHFARPNEASGAAWPKKTWTALAPDKVGLATDAAGGNLYKMCFNSSCCTSQLRPSSRLMVPSHQMKSDINRHRRNT